MQDFKAPGETPTLQRNNSALLNIKFLSFNFFWVVFAFMDLESADPLNLDPSSNPNPKHCEKVDFKEASPSHIYRTTMFPATTVCQYTSARVLHEK
jgi:hypothetical protein